MYRKILSLLLNFAYRLHANAEEAIRKLRNELYFIDFEDRDDDIYINTYLKSGTTWMQVIVYNLLTDGNMDFEHIYDVSPWPNNQATQGKSSEWINNLPSPRIMKAHNDYDWFSTDCKAKFIFVYRDGKDVAVSLYHHNKNYLNPDLKFDDTFEDFYTNEKAILNWFVFTRKWLENKHNFNILYVTYEQLKSDFDNTLNKIADFLHVELSNEIIERTKKHASFQYMKDHESKFGEKRPISERKIFDQFIRKGESGEGVKYMNETQLEFYNKHYMDIIYPLLQKKI